MRRDIGASDVTGYPEAAKTAIWIVLVAASSFLQMNRRRILMVSAMTVLGLAMLLPGSAVSQQKLLKDQLIGTWTFVSTTAKLADGSPAWGSNPKGLLIFTENGRFSLRSCARTVRNMPPAVSGTVPPRSTRPPPTASSPISAAIRSMRQARHLSCGSRQIHFQTLREPRRSVRSRSFRMT
jgi:hypothetical protein